MIKKVLTIVGARPQFVKAATISRELKKVGIEEIIVHTGQHFDDNMSKVFFDEMDIPKPIYNLDIHGVSHGAMTGRMMEEIEKILLNEKPDIVLVFGDTNSTLAGSLAAKKLHIKLVHIEAGLRSFNLDMPEEINRILTDRISDILFCPTETAVNNLMDEGYEKMPCDIKNVGDVMYDAALYYSKRSSEKSSIIKNLNLEVENFVLCTIHRQENTDDTEKLKSIINALNEINKTTKVITPLHPRTKQLLEKHKITPYFTIIEPVGYFDMIELIKNCKLVMTDSGGLQKEAYFFNKYCITLRDETEWVELVENKFNIITGADNKAIISAFTLLVDKKPMFTKKLYGTGNAGQKIVDILKNY